MTTTEEALAEAIEADLTRNEMYEIIGRLTVLAPDALVQAIRNMKMSQASKAGKS